jgi:hypothetical protein
MYTESEHDRAMRSLMADIKKHPAPQPHHKPMTDAWLPEDFDQLDAEMMRRGHLMVPKDDTAPDEPTGGWDAVFGGLCLLAFLAFVGVLVVAGGAQ